MGGFKEEQMCTLCVKFGEASGYSLCTIAVENVKFFAKSDKIFHQAA